MPSPTPDNSPPPPGASLAAWLRRWLVWLLLGSYVLAALVPAPGTWLTGLRSGEGVSFSLVMVGVLLLTGAMAVNVGKLRELPRHPVALLTALAGVWGPPVVVVALWSILAPACLPGPLAASLGVGMAFAGAMPVANSAVAWTHQSGGSLAWALGLVVLSICLCPWVTPLVLGLMGQTLAGASAAEADLLVSRFSGAVFVVWVLVPTLLGLGLHAALGGHRVERLAPRLTIASAAALLLLNYANAATALPNVLAEPDWRLLGTTLVAAVTLPVAGAAVAWPLSVLGRVSRRGRVAWAYSLGMKNTGLALGLVGATLGDQPVAILVILAVTLMQHVVAGAVHAIAARSEG